MKSLSYKNFKIKNHTKVIIKFKKNEKNWKFFRIKCQENSNMHIAHVAIKSNS
jgi:Holliday junction resolvase